MYAIVPSQKEEKKEEKCEKKKDVCYHKDKEVGSTEGLGGLGVGSYRAQDITVGCHHTVLCVPWVLGPVSYSVLAVVWDDRAICCCSMLCCRR